MEISDEIMQKSEVIALAHGWLKESDEWIKNEIEKNKDMIVAPFYNNPFIDDKTYHWSISEIGYYNDWNCIIHAFNVLYYKLLNESHRVESDFKMTQLQYHYAGFIKNVKENNKFSGFNSVYKMAKKLNELNGK